MFKDRVEAGKKLAKILEQFRGRKDCVVLGLARGGVVVAAEVAKALGLKLGVIVPRKLGAPDNPELAIGAVMESGEGYLNVPLIRDLGVSKEYIEAEVNKARKLAAERRALYEKAAPLPLLKNKTVILVDDGIATGATMFASIQGVKKQKAAQVVVAIPVASTSALYALKALADEVFCVDTEDLGAISMSYEYFSQVEDKDVIALLEG
ncbi:MAG: phosphoribosyltransferase family protein [Rhabdochlamydiaceae bacterium]